MPKYPELLSKILLGTSDTNIRFDELCDVLRFLGFRMRVKGSHHIFTKEGIADRLNLQEESGKAKTYQVRQVRKIILKNKLWSN
jgi:hypothetical protein